MRTTLQKAKQALINSSKLIGQSILDATLEGFDPKNDLAQIKQNAKTIAEINKTLKGE